MHGFQRILSIDILLSVTEMNLCKVATTEELSDVKLLFEVEQDHKLLHRIDPLLPLFHRVHVEIDSLSLGHYYEAVEILEVCVLKIVLLQPAIFDV